MLVVDVRSRVRIGWMKFRNSKSYYVGESFL